MNDNEKESTESGEMNWYNIELDGNKECRVRIDTGIMIHLFVYGWALYGLIMRTMLSGIEKDVKGIGEKEKDNIDDKWLIPKDFETGFYICIYDEKEKQEWIIGRKHSFEKHKKYSKRLVEQVSKNCQIIKLKAENTVPDEKASPG